MEEIIEITIEKAPPSYKRLTCDYNYRLKHIRKDLNGRDVVYNWNNKWYTAKEIKKMQRKPL